MSRSSPQPTENTGSEPASDRDPLAPAEVEEPGRRWYATLWLVPFAILAAVMVWFMLKEVIEPHWTIRLGDLVRPGSPPVIMALGNGLALHAYADTRPHVGKITPLQKGSCSCGTGRS